MRYSTEVSHTVRSSSFHGGCWVSSHLVKIKKCSFELMFTEHVTKHRRSNRRNEEVATNCWADSHWESCQRIYWYYTDSMFLFGYHRIRWRCLKGLSSRSIDKWHTNATHQNNQHITSPRHIHPVNTTGHHKTSRRKMAYRQMGGFGPVGWALATP